MAIAGWKKKTRTADAVAAITPIAPALKQQGTASLAVVVNSGSATSDLEYPVADLIGRFFLRICFWIDVCTSWAKKYRAPVFTAVPAKGKTLPVTAPTAALAASSLTSSANVSSSTIEDSQRLKSA